MMAVEAVKENFYCFLGIVHPTYYQSRGWGPWLGFVSLCDWDKSLNGDLWQLRMPALSPLGFPNDNTLQSHD